jgi:ribosomal protein L40E
MQEFITAYTLIAGILILALVSAGVLAIKDRIFSKLCPECLERVKPAAVKCRFCGHVF